MAIYSHSKLDSYESCPHRFKLRYLDRIQRYTEGIEGFMGSRIHETLEKLYRDVRLAKVPPIEDLTALYEALWDKRWHDDVRVVRRDYVADDYRRLGRRCIEDYYRRYEPFDQGRTLGLEQRVVVDIAGGRCQLQGFIDRLTQAADGEYEIHDYKSSGSLPSQADMEGDRQLALYQIGVQNRWTDVRRVHLVWHYLAFDKEIRSYRTPEQLAELEADLVALIEQVEAATVEGDFPTKESSLCDWCEYPDLCPARKHLYTVAELSTNEYLSEPGVVLVNKFAQLEAGRRELKEAYEAELAAIEAELDQLKEAVIAYAAREGVEVMVGSDHRLKVRLSQKTKFPTKDEPRRQELDGLLKEARVWLDVSDLSSSKLAKLIDSGTLEPTLAGRIKAYQIVEEKLSVTLSKLKEEDKLAAEVD